MITAHLRIIHNGVTGRLQQWVLFEQGGRLRDGYWQDVPHVQVADLDNPDNSEPPTE